MHWGQQHQAAYQLLQTEAGGASDRLCPCTLVSALAWLEAYD